MCRLKKNSEQYSRFRRPRLVGVLALSLAAAVAQSKDKKEKQVMDAPQPGMRTITIPTIDISKETSRQVIVAAGTDEIYQGHPTTLLMPDGKTLFCVWTRNHGGPCGPLKRSDDGGMTWSDDLPVPDNWRKVHNCPAIYRLPDPEGRYRLFVFAGQGPGGTMHQSYSEDDGKTWTPMVSNGLTCVMPFCTIVPIKGGKQLLAMSNIRRYIDGVEEKWSNIVTQSISLDGGMTWSDWRILVDIPECKIAEPELIRSPDGSQLLCLMRENNRAFNSWMMVTDDEGETWSEATQLPASISGDRHMAAYALDGRLVVCYRDTAQKSPTLNHFVAWVGTYDDIIAGREGHYRIKLLHNYAGADCGYPGLECLPDGTLVATTYIKYTPGPEKHSVVSVRFTLGEMDEKVREGTCFIGTSVDSCQPVTAPNLAAKARVEASSEFKKASFPPANATDGDFSAGGRWVSDSGPEHWLTLTWPEQQEINRVRVWTGHPGKPELRVSDYTIQYWDGTAWQIAASVVDNDRSGPQECNDLTFPTVKADRLKMNITRTPTGNARVFEIEVYGEKVYEDRPDNSGPVAVGAQAQLFVDDAMIREHKGVNRTIHACTKLPESVLQAEMPWEGNEQDQRVYLYGTVLRDPASGTLRMWYNRGKYLCYATSTDGIHWERPVLGVFDYRGSRDNNICTNLFHSPSIVFDQHESDPAKRYKMFGALGGQDGYGAAYSADGFTWHAYPGNPVITGGDTCTLAQDPETGEYLAFHKLHSNHRGHNRRLVYLSTSTDMQTWSGRKLVMAPDAIDDAQAVAEGYRWGEFYNMSVFLYGGQYLGLVTSFHYRPGRKDVAPGQSGADGPINVQLTCSRDGRNWKRLAQRNPVIPNGPYDYDAGCILGVANGPVIVGDEMWVYYTAITTTHGGALPEKKISIARAAWRVDGFVSLDAGQEPGTVETVVIRPDGDRLSVNADVSDGELRVVVLDAGGAPLPGYAAADCVPVTGDSVRHPVRWHVHDRLPAGQPVSLRFEMTNASLYSYLIEDTTE